MRCRRDPSSKGARLRAPRRAGAAPAAGALEPPAAPGTVPPPASASLPPAPRDVDAAPRRIEGREPGPIRHPASLVIGPHGSVTGDLHAPEIIVEGEVRGDLHAGERIRLEAGARVVGNLHAPRIGIEPGARLQGRISTRAAGSPMPLDDSGVEALLAGKPGSAR